MVDFSEEAMELAHSFYAVGNLQKKGLRICYTLALCSQPNNSADHLQTICNSVFRLFPKRVGALKGPNISPDSVLTFQPPFLLSPFATTELILYQV